MSTGAVVLHEGDNRAPLRAMPENSIDAVVTDPPYSLTSITKRFGKPGAAPARTDKSDGSFARFFNSFPADDFPWPMAFYHSKAGKADRRADLVDRDAGEKPHPTVKPIGLLRHLVRHICPPGGTVLDPFGGTGTTAEAARLEGCNAVLMEAEPEYIAFLRRRFDLPDPFLAMFG